MGGDLQKPVVLVLGDSHSKVFQRVARRGQCSEIEFISQAREGATAYGCMNEKSRSCFYPKAIKWMDVKWVSKPTHAALMLGEVDAGRLAYVRSEREGITPQRQVELSASNAVRFASIEMAPRFERIILLGAPLPCVPDGVEHRLIRRRELDGVATMAQRTAVTLHYNAKLREFAEACGFRYTDITKETLDGDVVSKRFWQANGDHHMSHNLTYPLWINAIEGVL